MPETTGLTKDEVWGDAVRAAAALVADELTAACGGGKGVADLVREVVDQAVCRVLGSAPKDVFVVTEHPALGATHHVTLAFCPDKFREHLTAAAHQDLVARGHAVSPVAGSQVGV